MVALKQHKAQEPHGILLMKQERRGGIETKDVGIFPLHCSCEKQERRGGIETHERAIPARSGNSGSRNAVVALKPERAARDEQRKWRKQERRGGIETEPNHSRSILLREEVGTPWWH